MTADLVAEARSANLLRVAEALGARLKRIGAGEFAGPCPTCGGRDRFSVNVPKGVFNCRGCGVGGDAIRLVRHVAGLDFVEAVERITGGRLCPHDAVPTSEERIAEEARREAEESEQKARSTAKALAMWDEGADPRGTPAERYLASRELNLGIDLAGEVLRWHPERRALMALFRSIATDEPQAIMRLFFDAQGRPFVIIDPDTGKETKDRRFLGPVGGAAIKLDPNADVLGGLFVGEGIETSMTARVLDPPLKPTWALGSNGAIARLPVLPGVEVLSIIRERDEANRAAAEVCGSRWLAAGREVFDVWPNRGNDVNDAIREDAA
ncbi:Toprim domain-containing protein [Roseiarcus fermentans]|uniref:Toprim domain-containing protein n=1 Tax=Roseiarcus fermentans TaxID=1473586 RepID=A0A366FWT3_9HYPH|nr:CHC2 zinc finger domain-containing protein [Roseiarcus fermentans]RBP18159.1 Toprim domain-containing protein [Roseiarcus fermentans]